MLESTTYPGTTRERSSRCSRSRGSPPGRDFNVAFSPERIDPGRTDYTLRNTPKIVGGLTAGLPASARSSCTSEVCDEVVPVSTPRGRRADQAARERLPLGEHRARQRAGDAVRPDGHRRLGGRRRRGDQALRLHVASSRGRGWAGTACRSTPSTWPGGRASSTCRRSSSSWPARSTSAMPYFCVERIARALNDHSKPVTRVADRRSSASPTSRASAICASARRSRSSGCCASGRGRRLPRRLRGGAARLRPASANGPAEADCVVIVTAHPGARRGARRAGVAARRRLPRRDSRDQARAPGPAVSVA